MPYQLDNTAFPLEHEVINSSKLFARVFVTVGVNVLALVKGGNSSREVKSCRSVDITIFVTSRIHA